MKTIPTSVATVYAQLREWYRQVPGRLVLRAERDQLDTLLPTFAGKRITQLGCLGVSSLLTCSKIPHHILLDPDLNVESDIHARLNALPFDVESIDVLVLPHTLEVENNPYEILHEVTRVLAPEGHLVIIGFNPWGLWGLWRLLGGHQPWRSGFLELSLLCKWLSLLDFQTINTRYFFFRPPLQHEPLMRNLAFLEPPDSCWWLPLGGLYLVIAQKRIAAMTPIRLRWEEVRPSVPELCWAEPTVPEVTHGN